MTSEEVLDLYRIKVFTAADNNVFFTVNKVNKTVLIFLSHITCIKPAVLQCFGSSLFVTVVALHNSGTFDKELANLSALDFFSVFISYSYFPAEACFSDGTDFVYILDTKMYTARSDRFAETVICVILMLRKYLFPA